MNKFKIAIFIITIVVATAYFVWFFRGKDDVHEVVAITFADRIEIFRIDARHIKRAASEYIGDYPVISKSLITRPQSKEQLVRFIQPYFQDHSYRPNTTRCIQQPGLALRIWQGENYLEVLVCFSCELLIILDHHEEWHDFSEDRRFLVNLVKLAFPQDRAVQRLSEKESTTNDLALENGSG